MSGRRLVWFRADLRVRDNTALSEACRSGDGGVVGVFTICPEQWREHDWAPVRVDFLLRNLADLRSSLEEMNIPLRIVRAPRFDGVPAALLELAEEVGADSIWLNREYEVNELARDREVRRVFEDSGREVREFEDQVVVAPDALRTTEGRYYTVFTPYRRAWVERVKDQGGVAVHRRPTAQDPTGIESSEVPESLEEFEGLRRPDLWKSGEDHAMARLRAFVSRRIEDYAETRDRPALNGTSTLSPYLALGVLSPRQCLRAALDANRDRLDSGKKSIVTWISEVVWREFYRHVLVGYPRVCRERPYRLETEAMEWNDDPEAFERWREGRTGYPMVDAGMRQLAATGWMHNRVRMIVAMFLSKNLFLDWRLGERHFMRNLVDGDFANNSGGWQWSASVGTDAAPYFRVFNPVTQSEKCDPDGEYIRRFVPELESVRGKAIHFPHERAAPAVGSLGYPEPIVDHKSTRKEAIERFKAASKG